jgi:pimeloyl-ACP methyl ester carboxylesterase
MPFHAFFQTLQGVIDHDGQSVAATDRLYLTSRMPTLILWGARDRSSVRHAFDAHDAIPEAASRSTTAWARPHCEDPERFVATLADFVDSTSPACLTEGEWYDLLRNAQ